MSETEKFRRQCLRSQSAKKILDNDVRLKNGMDEIYQKVGPVKFEQIENIIEGLINCAYEVGESLYILRCIDNEIINEKEGNISYE